MIPVSFFCQGFLFCLTGNSNFNFFPWEYTLETECEILWIDINIQYM